MFSVLEVGQMKSVDHDRWTLTPPFPAEVESFRISTMTWCGADVVVVSGEIDAFTGRLVTRHVDGIAKASGAQVLVDLSGVTFMDAGGLGAPVACSRLLAQRSADLVLVCQGGPALRLLTLLKLDRAWRVYATRDHAVGEICV